VIRLVTLVEANEISILEKNLIEFNKLPNGSKLKAASELYTENQLLKGLGEVAIDVIEIERMDEQMENMEKESKDNNQYDDEKMKY